MKKTKQTTRDLSKISSEKTVAPEQDTVLPWYKNLLAVPLLRSVVQHACYPYLLQFGALCFFVLVISIGWDQPVFEMGSAAEKLYRKLNFTTFAIWGLWWTSMIWIAFFIGRAWCQVCPLELIANIAERLGRWLGIKQKLIPKLFRNGILIVSAYLVVQFCVSSFHIHRIPHRAALFLITLGAAAFSIGFFFKYRFFCSYVCPVGMLLSCYARNSPFELRSIDKKVCERCRTKDCRSQKTYKSWNKRGCPSLLNPPQIDSNKDCLLCMQCVKACPHNNISFGIRKFFKDIAVGEKAPLALSFFLVIITGFLTYEMILNKEIKEMFLIPPHWAIHFTGIVNPYMKGFFKGLWMLVIFPGAIWLSCAAMYKILSTEKKFTFYLSCYSIAFIPLLVSAHLSKALEKWNGWLKGIWLPFRDPSGVRTFNAIFVEKTLIEPGKIVALSTLRWLPLTIVLTGTIISIIKIAQTNSYLNKSSPKTTIAAHSVPLGMALLLGAMYIFNILMWK